MPTNVLVLNKSWLVTGSGDPEGREGAPAGSLYLREDGAAGSSLYVKEGGTGTTGWRSFPAPPVSYVDLVEAVPGPPSPDVARLYGLDANGYTVFEVVDSAGRVLRPVRDNILIAKVVEAAGVTRGQVLYVSGASGSNVLVRLAKADSSATMPAVGLAMDAAANNGFIRVMLLGRLDALDTSVRTEGEHLYVSATTAGAWTNVPPPSPALLQQVAIVARQHATNGDVLVLVSGALSPQIPAAHHVSHEPGGSDVLANVPWTNQVNTFMAQQTVSAGSPGLNLVESDETANAKNWQLIVSGKILRLSANDDAWAILTIPLVIYRSGDVDVQGALKASGGLDTTPLNASQLTSGSVPDARLSGNVALKTSELDLTGGSGTAYYGATIEIQTVATPRVSFHWPGVVAAQIGMDSAGVIRTFDNPGTGYAPFAASKVVTNASGNNLADLTVGATNFQNGVTVTGGAVTCQGSTVAATITSAGNVHAGGNIHNLAGYMYPGNLAAGGGNQASWYLASHSSYGLYSNTGFFNEGGFSSNAGVNVAGAIIGGSYGQVATTFRAGTGLYERGRGPALGDWTASGIQSWGNMPVGAGDNAYTLIGGTVLLQCNITSCYSATAQPYYYLWSSWTAARRVTVGCMATVGGNLFGMTAETVVSSNQIVLRPNTQISIPAGDLAVCFCIIIPLN